MERRQRAVVMLVVGALLVLVSAAADSLGVGGAPGFGWKQITGVALGVVLAIAGAATLRRRWGRRAFGER